MGRATSERALLIGGTTVAGQLGAVDPLLPSLA
jgi:hypothetical protein